MAWMTLLPPHEAHVIPGTACEALPLGHHTDHPKSAAATAAAALYRGHVRAQAAPATLQAHLNEPQDNSLSQGQLPLNRWHGSPKPLPFRAPVLLLTTQG
jgi:hypothetical protein